MQLTVESTAIVVKPGMHVARITDVIYGESQYGKTVKFLFAVNDEPNEPIISGLCSCNRLTPTTKLYRWLSALNGGTGLEKGATIEPEAFVDSMVEILVTNSKKDDIEYSNVSRCSSWRNNGFLTSLADDAIKRRSADMDKWLFSGDMQKKPS